MSVNTAKLEYYIGQAGFKVPTKIKKRDGNVVKFDIHRIERAVEACYNDVAAERDTRQGPMINAAVIAENATRALSVRFKNDIPTVEAVQDAVEFALLSAGDFEAAKHYILYRDQHSQSRKKREVPTHVTEAFDRDKKFFSEPAQLLNFYDKYSRYNWDLGRRETWNETVDRAVDHLRWEVEQHMDGRGGLSEDLYSEIHSAILNLEVMPSMRLLAMAGPAAQRNSMALYNCSYLPVKDIQSFVEAMHISMAGCGVGFSVEREYVEQFPRIKRQRKNQDIPTHVVDDSTEGWAETLRLGLEAWWDGRDIKFDYTFVRPYGAPLKTKGGRASGPEPLRVMMDFLRTTIIARQGSFIRTTDAHIMMCAVGEAAVQGGVRRTAMISLFDWDDHEMRNIKSSANMNPLLWNANNSAVWPEDVSDVDIMQQMLDMIKTRSGEPGIFSRTNAQRTKPKRRKKAAFGTNPCGEIMLRPYGFCNLSQAVSRPGDTEEDLARKVRLATIIGTIQSLSTRFPGLRDDWKKNAEEERLLGVDLTAQVDCELLRPGAEGGDRLRSWLATYAVEVNAEFAEILGIEPSAAISCNKPAGNSAEVLNSSNGIHGRHAPYYMRRYTIGAHTPIFKVLKDAGIPMEPQVGSDSETATKWIVSIPKKSPDGAPVKADLGAVDQCEFWLLNKENWTEHNPSCTITYRADEVVDLVAWVVKNKDKIGGLSFFPASDAIYAQAPFEEITQEQYEELIAEFPDVDYSQIYVHELEDMTTAAQELACFAGSCEV